MRKDRKGVEPSMFASAPPAGPQNGPKLPGAAQS